MKEVITRQIEEMSDIEINKLIEVEIFKAVPLTHEEWTLLKVGWDCMSPSWRGFGQPLKVPMERPHPETGAMFRFQWPQNYCAGDYGSGSRMLIDQMRKDGWLFSLYDQEAHEDLILRIVSFTHPCKKYDKGQRYRNAHTGEAMHENEARAVAVAALKAVLRQQDCEECGNDKR